MRSIKARRFRKVRFRHIADTHKLLHSRSMDEEHLTPVWKIGCALAFLCVAAVIGWLAFTLLVVSHDKSLNSRLGILWNQHQGVPLGIVLPAKNPWIENAFVAEASGNDHRHVVALILDDHYRSGDFSLRSESGVIGDRLSRKVLCSVPAQARTKSIALDPVVQSLIAVECHIGAHP